MSHYLNKDWRGEMEHKITAKEMRDYQQWRQRLARIERQKREEKKDELL